MSLNPVKIESEANKTDEPFEVKEVKYELNTLENLKKAKENISRDERITRKLIDDENIKFELQSGVYLEVKKKALELKKGDIISDRDVGVEMKVSYIRRSITKIKKDCPQASIHFEVIDHRTQQTTKCVQHLYHTNQTIHLQGVRG